MLLNFYSNQLHSEEFIYNLLFFFLECPNLRKSPYSLLVQVLFKASLKFALHTKVHKYVLV